MSATIHSHRNALNNITNFVVRIVSADGLAPLGARPSAGTILTTHIPHIYRISTLRVKITKWPAHLIRKSTEPSRNEFPKHNAIWKHAVKCQTLNIKSYFTTGSSSQNKGISKMISSLKKYHISLRYCHVRGWASIFTGKSTVGSTNCWSAQFFI